MSSKRVTARFHHVGSPAPKLEDVSDGGRVAIFDPNRCVGDQNHWIQINEEHAVPAEECR